MNKKLCLLMAVLALSAVIDCKVGLGDGNNQHDICSTIGCVNNQRIIRNKRANGRAVFGGVENLVNGIIKSPWNPSEKAKAHRRKKTIVIGSG